MDTVTVVIILAAVVLAGFMYLAFRLQALQQAAARPPDAELPMSLLQNQVHAMSQQSVQQMDLLRTEIQRLQAQVGQSMETSRKTMDDRLAATGTLVQGVGQKLAQLDESTRHLSEMGKNLTDLQKILQAPKLRGNLGELFLQELLAQILPPAHYEMQYAFSNGQKVDAVIRLMAGLVPVDAKFPLESFRRYLDAATEEDRKAQRKELIRAVRGHIDDIAGKYIRTDEGTFDFALMYIPAENVYYEVIVRDTEFNADLSLFTYALGKRVIPVSPNSFYAYLQTVLLGLKGMRVEERAREIIDSLAGLRKNFELFDDAFQRTGKQLRHSQQNYDEASRQFDRVRQRLDLIEQTTDQTLPAAPEVPLAPDKM